MKAKDVAILLVCCIAVLLSMRQEGGLSLTVSWFHPINPTASLAATYRNGHSPDISEKLPPPIVTDIDGDGRNEIVLCTREPKLKILQYAASEQQPLDAYEQHELLRSDVNPQLREPVRSADALVLRGEVSLLAHTHKMRRGRQPAAMATGYLRPYSATASGKGRGRKQVIVVVTDGFELLVYNHRLKLLWHRAMDVDMRHSFLHEIAVTVNSHGLRANDTGAVIVGARLALKRDIAKYALHKNWKKSKKQQQNHANKQTAGTALEAQGKAEAGEVHGHGHGGPKKEFDTLEDLSRGSAAEEFDAKHHFSFYAFDGRSGRLRWKHEAGDFYEEAPAHQVLKAQHSTHSGEMDWRRFRADILSHALPHGWWSREDTRFSLIELHPQRPGKERRVHQQHKLHHTGAGGGGGLLNAPAAVASAASAAVPSELTAAFGGLLPHNADEHIEHPNAVVAHLKDGIEVIHYYSGRTLCRLSLKSGAMHVDVNGDGVIDHIEAVASMPSNSPLLHARQGHTRLPKCLGLVSSGIPPQQQLYNGTICHLGGFLTQALLRDPKIMTGMNPLGLSAVPKDLAARLAGDGGIVDDEKNVFVTLPAVLLQVDTPHIDFVETAPDHDHPVSRPTAAAAGKGVSGGTTGRTFRSAFFINDGTVTSYNAEGHGAWQAATQAKWLLDFDDDMSVSAQLRTHALHPSLTPYSLRAHDGLHDHLLVIGEDTLSVVYGEDGAIRTEHALSEVVVGAPVLADWTHDRWTDIILTSPRGYYGLSLERSVGFQFFTILIAGLLFALVLVFIFTIAGGTEDTGSAPAVFGAQTKRLRGKHI